MHSEKLTINKPKFFVYIAMIGIIVASLIVNRDLSTTRHIISNFVVPSMLLHFGLLQEKRAARVILLITGLIYFGYITLYYLIGFHNPNWGN